MRDNVSIIFAAVFAVILLIVFPLFSLMSRQDSISYNKVLTLTTEFVDSVRTKGYFTDEEYSDYLIKLSSTGNTYKVDMEYHRKLLIKDVEHYTEENPVWVEDTEVFYNKYITEELGKSHVIGFNEGDEFYVKVYNTNTTTASLLYNYFLRSNIPRKVINIGYGGKISNVSGNKYARTDFSTSYTPYITFEEVTNESGDDFKICYDEYDATIEEMYEIERCIREIDIENSRNNPITVKFKMHNFKSIGDIELTTFATNKESIGSKIKEYVTLRGQYIDEEEGKHYNIDVTDLSYNSNTLDGTIKISNINLTVGSWRTKAHIVVGSGLGVGITGISSAEATTKELTLSRKMYDPAITINGPYQSKTSTEVLVDAIITESPVYFKVALRDCEKLNKIELFDTINSKTILTLNLTDTNTETTSNGFKVTVERATASNSGTDDYWVVVTPSGLSATSNGLSLVEQQVQIVAYADGVFSRNELKEIKASSNNTLWRFGSDVRCESITEGTYESIYYGAYYLTFTFDRNTMKIVNTKFSTDITAFFRALINSGYLYITDENNQRVPIGVASVTQGNGNRQYNLYYKFLQNEQPTGGIKKINPTVNFVNPDGILQRSISSKYINLPKLCNPYINGSVLGISLSQTYAGSDMLWIPSNVSDIEDYCELDGKKYFSYYDDEMTKKMIRDSIEKYGGFYIAIGNYFEKYDFVWAFNEAKEICKLFKHSDKFFSSMAYNWQIEKAIASYGDFLKKESENTYLWIANKSDDGNAIKFSYRNMNPRQAVSIETKDRKLCIAYVFYLK